VANDDDLRASLASRGMERARAFTRRACAETTRRVYDEAIARRR